MGIAYPKPKPREKSVRAGGRSSGKRSKAWKDEERETARWFQEHAGVDPNPPVEPSSTGRVGHLLRYDLTSATYIGECKRRPLPKWIHEAWAQICFLALDRGNRHPTLILTYVSDQKTAPYKGKKVRLPELHVLTPERHAELLSYEALVKGDERSEISKADLFDYIEVVADDDAQSAA